MIVTGQIFLVGLAHSNIWYTLFWRWRNLLCQGEGRYRQATKNSNVGRGYRQGQLPSDAHTEHSNLETATKDKSEDSSDVILRLKQQGLKTIN